MTRIFQNYHRHSTHTNVRVSDSVVYNEDYAKRAAELGHGIISTMEHGWQGRYIEGYELAKKYNLKFVFGAEAYWVKNRKKEYDEVDENGNKKTDKKGNVLTSKDGSNCHICIFARNENGRQAINDILAEANISGFYKQPRIDLELIMSLPENDVIITTACVAFWKYKDIDNIVAQLHAKFKNNFFLEVQYHNTEKQKNLNLHIKYLAKIYGIKMIMGCDSHYISSDTAWERNEYLISKDMKYPDEEGWYLDYPDGDEAYRRFVEQGILNEAEINEAFESTNVFLEVEEYDNPCFDKGIKMPILPENKALTQEQRNEKYKRLIYSLWDKEKPAIMQNLNAMDNVELSKYICDHEFNSIYFSIPNEDVFKLSREEKNKIIIHHYEKEIEKEVDTVIAAKHADYFLMDYELIREAVKNGGMLTNTGRGSAVSFYTNKLLGFTKIDRISAKVKMYPERFMSATRILEAGTLADIDFNVGNQDVFAATQKQLFGEQCSYPMIAYGKYKASSAFKMYAKAKDVDYEIANEITKQIKQYELDLNNAEDDEKDNINLYDYVDEKYHDILDDSKKYLGIISSWSPHPCAFLVYNGNIRKEIGLVMIRSKQGKKSVLCSIMDGLWAEQYHFLKNDLLKVNVVKLIKMTYADIGIPEDDASSLLAKAENNDKVMDIYKNGYTIGINQVEQKGSRAKIMKYKPRNITELTAFSAAIRPSFKSMFDIYINRQQFSYGIKAFDDIIQTPEMQSSFILYQEMIMATLNYAGIPMSDCYTAIKCISKKRKEKIMKYKEIFIPNFTQKIIETEDKTQEEATELANQVWTIIKNSARYGFNASHAYCVSLDGLYGAYLKAYYPLNFYKIFLSIANEQGKKDKIAAALNEMKQAFDIELLPMRFRQDNRDFAICGNGLTGTLKSIKGFGEALGEQLYAIRDIKVNSFTDLLVYMIENNIMSKNIRLLISIGYFEEFGKAKKLLKIFDEVTEGKNKYSKTHKDATKEKKICALHEFEESLPDEDLSDKEKLFAEVNVFGGPRSTFKSLKNFLYVKEVNTNYSPKIYVRTITKGIDMMFKMEKKVFAKKPVKANSVILLNDYFTRPDNKFIDGKYQEIPNTKVYWIADYKEEMI